MVLWSFKRRPELWGCVCWIPAFPVSLTDQSHQVGCLYHSFQQQNTVKILRNPQILTLSLSRAWIILYSLRSLCHNDKMIHPPKVIGKLKSESGLPGSYNLRAKCFDKVGWSRLIEKATYKGDIFYPWTLLETLTWRLTVSWKNCGGKEKGFTESKEYNLVLKHFVSYQWELWRGPEGSGVELSKWKCYFRKKETGTKTGARKIHYKHVTHYKWGETLQSSPSQALSGLSLTSAHTYIGYLSRFYSFFLFLMPKKPLLLSSSYSLKTYFMDLYFFAHNYNYLRRQRRVQVLNMVP